VWLFGTARCTIVDAKLVIASVELVVAKGLVR